MADELVDIVNINNVVIGQVMKSVAHEKGLMHRTIISEIINTKGEWLLVKQAPDRQDKGQFVSPVGGHMGAGESEIDALKREAFEEVGMRNFSYTYIGRAIYKRTVLNRIENHLFICYQIFSDEKPVLNHESVGYEYFSMEKLKKELKENPSKFGDAFYFVITEFFSIFI